MNGASRWLDACVGPADDTASAAATKAAAIAFDSRRCENSLDMGHSSSVRLGGERSG
jgi:hypothetical protein